MTVGAQRRPSAFAQPPPKDEIQGMYLVIVFLVSGRHHYFL